MTRSRKRLFYSPSMRRRCSLRISSVMVMQDSCTSSPNSGPEGFPLAKKNVGSHPTLSSLRSKPFSSSWTLVRSDVAAAVTGLTAGSSAPVNFAWSPQWAAESHALESICHANCAFRFGASRADSMHVCDRFRQSATLIIAATPLNALVQLLYMCAPTASRSFFLTLFPCGE
jgi:hypothetical protein